MSSLRSILDIYQGRKILIAPLNWGLGHATRCAPVIELLSNYNQVYVASDGQSLIWLKKELIDIRLSFLELPQYKVRYDLSNPWCALFKYGTRVRRAIASEYRVTQDIIKSEGINLILSDHRLGVRSSSVESIIIAHQLMIPHQNRLISYISTQVQLSYLNRFDQCWVPDYEDPKESLSGNMSDPSIKITKRYIGPISRFSQLDSTSQPKAYDIAIILSGLEPARSKLEKKLIAVFSDLSDLKIALICGHSHSTLKIDHSHIDYFDLLDTRELQAIMNNSKIVISRSGYSSIMDFSYLGLRAILIPTPHQPEQEYLGRYHMNNPNYIILKEENISTRSIKEACQALANGSK